MQSSTVIWLSLFLALLGPGASNAAEEISGTASVIDGDTIDIHGSRIRLHAIDAIESRQRCYLPNGVAWRCGADAANALAEKVGRSPVSCLVNDVDRYGRYVAKCYLNGEDLNAWLVEKGWTVSYRRYGLDYVEHENRARSNKRGIWASEFEMPWDWRRNN
ncbi:thermonuclease family protein [Celeribacter litoreus]|uniref:thermonuclease family protein n=1 Tax=Celeribacter litoreus TaxID=2876714 RepID=UPI001CCA3C98|nr:thermonuclease family protein [Celeribacter litoreus]MCA0044666.1 thermonuclease family protein [Celeribacter litoreus]